MMTNNQTQRKQNYLLHIEDVYKRYDEKLVLDNIDLSVAESEFCTVVGPSGCGKSTLLRMVLGQEKPSEGSLYIDGNIIGYPNPSRGIVYQRYSLFPHLTVLENVTLGKRFSVGFFERLKTKSVIIEEAYEFLKRVKLEKHGHKFPHELSGGMQQRVAIAQALIMRPRILLMDEPFGALDPHTRYEMQHFLLELWEQEKMTIFFVTHDLDEAVYLGTRTFVLSQFYQDDRQQHTTQKHGAKIVADYKLPREAMSDSFKTTSEFKELVESIRKDGFVTDYSQHAKDFNLAHPDSFQTLTEGEHKEY